MPDDKSGTTMPGGAIALELNPPNVLANEGVVYNGAWVRAELDEGKLSVKVSAQVSYAGRTLTQSIEVTDSLEPLNDLLNQILQSYEPAIKAKTLVDGYQAYIVAQGRNELKEGQA